MSRSSLTPQNYKHSAFDQSEDWGGDRNGMQKAMMMTMIWEMNVTAELSSTAPLGF